MVRVAQITGATRGIGAATALVLAEHGYRVVVNHRASAPHAEVVVATIAAAGGEAAAKSPRATQRNISRKGTNDGREHGEAEGQGHVAREQTTHGCALSATLQPLPRSVSARRSSGRWQPRRPLLGPF